MRQVERRRFLMVAGTFVLGSAGVLAACSAPAASPTAAPAQPTTAPAAAPTAAPKPADAAAKPADTAKPAAAAPAKVDKPAKITVGYLGSIGFNHVPSYLAWDALKEKGYTIETKAYANPQLAGNALVSGEAQIGWIAAAGAMTAIKQGAQMKAFFHGAKLIFIAVTKKEVNSWKDLDGKSYGENVPGQVLDGLSLQMDKKYGVTRKIVRMNESDQRSNALLNGQLDGASLQPDDFEYINGKKPGDFKVLVKFADEFPTVGGTWLWATGDLITKYPDAMNEITEALLATYRKSIADENWFIGEAKKKLPDATEAVLRSSYKIYKDNKFWPTDGGVSTQIATDTAAFYKEAGLVADPPAPNQWMEPKFADAALAKLGR